MYDTWNARPWILFECAVCAGLGLKGAGAHPNI